MDRRKFIGLLLLNLLLVISCNHKENLVLEDYKIEDTKIVFDFSCSESFIRKFKIREILIQTGSTGSLENVFDVVDYSYSIEDKKIKLIMDVGGILEYGPGYIYIKLSGGYIQTNFDVRGLSDNDKGLVNTFLTIKLENIKTIMDIGI